MIPTPGEPLNGESVRLLIRCMGPWPACKHARNTCTATPAYQAEIAGTRPTAQADKTAPEGEWVEWAGGENPVPGQMVLVRSRNGREWEGQLADHLRWTHLRKDHDITAYRLVTPQSAPSRMASDAPAEGVGEAWSWLTEYAGGDGDPADQEYNCDDMTAAWRAGNAALPQAEPAAEERETGGMPVCSECGGWGEHLSSCSRYPHKWVAEAAPADPVAGVGEVASIAADISALCNGHPHAKIAWPHQELHAIADRVAALSPSPGVTDKLVEALKRARARIGIEDRISLASPARTELLAQIDQALAAARQTESRG